MKLQTYSYTAMALAASMMHAHGTVILQDQFTYANEAAFDAAYSGGPGGTEFAATTLDSPNRTGEAGGRAQINLSRRTRTIGSTIGSANSTVYVSFLMQTSSNLSSGPAGAGVFRTIEFYTGGTREYAIGLLRSDGNSSDTNSSSSAQFEHRDYGQGNTVTPDLGAFTSDVNLFVIKLNYTNVGTTNNFTADAWLNPTNSTDFDAANSRISGTNLSFNAFALASFADSTGTNAQFDEIIFTDDIADLNLVPEPSVSLLGLMGVLGLLRRRR